MVGFAPVDEWVAGDVLELPAQSPAHPHGRTYRVPSCPAKVGVKLEALYARSLEVQRARREGRPVPADTELDDDDELDLYRDALGPVHAQLVEDGVPWAMLKHLALTSFYWHVAGREVAEKYWRAPTGDPTKRPAMTSTSTGGASTTR